MKKRLIYMVAAVIVATVLIAGCASSVTETSMSYAEPDYAAGMPAIDTLDKNESGVEYAAEADVNSESDGIGPPSLSFDSAASVLEPGVDRKVVYTGTIEASTKNFDEDYQKIMGSLEEAGGYIESASVYGTKPEDWQDSGRTASLTIRVPSDKFDAFMTMLNGIGKNISSSISGQDISLQYYDTETQLSTLRIREERLQKLLEEAAGLEDIIEIERELADVSYQIQMLETSLRDYDSLIDYSTISIYLQEENDIEGITSSEEDIGSRISNGFFSVLNAIADFGEGLLVFIISGSPILVPLAVIIIVIVILVKRSRKKRMNHNMGTSNIEQKGDNNNEK